MKNEIKMVLRYLLILPLVGLPLSAWLTLNMSRQMLDLRAWVVLVVWLVSLLYILMRYFMLADHD